jgi:diketogulonate reductase-like aldo/keto reductase
MMNSNGKPPKIIYGTAWKETRTADLVHLALSKGFRAIDTACQPKHYHEPGVGEGLRRAYSDGIKREDLFLQTKFTPLSGQDPQSIPYDHNAGLKDQVLESMEVSKKNLGTKVIDSLVLHSPMNSWYELAEVWETFEGIVSKGEAVQIGISNCYDLRVLEKLVQDSNVKPSFVQNRLYQQSAYDFELRKFCLENKILYQSFWTLSANPHILQSEIMMDIAHRRERTSAQIFFRYLSQQNIVPLTGTTSEKHMEEDLSIFEFELDEEECGLINALGPFI